MARLRLDPFRVDQPITLQSTENRIDRPFGEEKVGMGLKAAKNVESVKPASPEARENRKLQPTLSNLRFPVLRGFQVNVGSHA